MMDLMTRLVALVLLVAALPVLAQMEPAPPPAGEMQMIEATAIVEDVDLAQRLATIKGENGVVIVRV